MEFRESRCERSMILSMVPHSEFCVGSVAERGVGVFALP
jgi:hypothetical protein